MMKSRFYNQLLGPSFGCQLVKTEPKKSSSTITLTYEYNHMFMFTITSNIATIVKYPARSIL